MATNSELGLEQLKAIADASSGQLELLSPFTADNATLVDVSVDTSGIPVAATGMPLRQRERFILRIPPDFPYEAPCLWTRHRRFLGYPHVYWGQYLCLYQAPEAEWNPADGMFGFMDRVDLFLHKAAAGELDPIGAPMHPPVSQTLTQHFSPTIIPKVDTPDVQDEPWFGFVTIENISKNRIDLTGWVDVLKEEWPDGPVGAAVLLANPLSHEFPTRIGDLVRALQHNGINRKMLVLIIRCALAQAEADTPLLLVVGAPMRGISGRGKPKQHLTAWWIDKDIANALRRFAPKGTDSQELRTLRNEVETLYLAALEDQPVTWCTVLEDRPEIIVRRDLDSAANWFQGKKVALWGCGAIGAQLAEGFVRAGAASVVLYDKAQIKPGILVRQPFDDRDIGRYKAIVLASRLQRIRPNLDIVPHLANVLTEVLDRPDWDDEADIVIDATASRAVLAKIEWARKAHFRRVPIASMVLGPTAQTCMLLVGGRGHSGGPLEISRHAKLALLHDPGGAPYLADFFPAQACETFQPEPGCSEPTFVGSYADVASLSHLMLNALPSILSQLAASEAAAWFFGPVSSTTGGKPLHYVFDGMLTSHDVSSGYEIRISRSAWSTIQAIISRSPTRRGRRVETGGIILGQRDETLKIMWVDDFTPPPPDSTLTTDLFICGIVGTKELHERSDTRSQGSARYLGMWHTHPESYPVPSVTDLRAMKSLSEGSGSTHAHTLMVIIGTPFTDLTLATYAFSAQQLQGPEIHRTCTIIRPPSSLKRDR